MTDKKPYYATHVWAVDPVILKPARDKVVERMKELMGPHLSNMENQERTVLERDMCPQACPICRMPLVVVDAKTAHQTLYESDGHACPCCTVKLKFTVPFVDSRPYYWTALLDDDQIDKMKVGRA